MSYRKFENFAKIMRAVRISYYEMERLVDSWLSLYESKADRPKQDRVQEILNLMDSFVDKQTSSIEETFFGRKFKYDVLGDYIRGNDDYYFMYEGTKFYYNNLLELYNQLNEIVEQEEEANEIL